MTDVVLSDRSIASMNIDAIIIATSNDDDDLVILPGAEDLDEAMGGGLKAALEAVRATGREGDVATFATLGATKAALVVAVGLGSTNGSDEHALFTAEQVRRAAGCAARACVGRNAVAITLAKANGQSDPELVEAAVEGFLLGGYQFNDYRSEKPKARDLPAKKASVIVDKPRGADNAAALKKAVAASAAVMRARDFINTPPLDLYPEAFAEQARQLGKAAGLKVEVLDERRLSSGGYGGILAVGSGSDRKPRLVRLSYAPAGLSAKTPHVALVGKGITFDTGGISLKPGLNMGEMKSDMSGAAAMINAILLIAELELPIKVTATIPIAENMPSGSAYRPADVITHRGGKRSEILNTDAEGRVVLADAIARACEDKPDYLIEASTLTGAQIVALGKRTAGVMGSDDFRDRIVGAANCVGEAAWAMPLPKEVRDGMKSKVADLANIGDGPGGMLAGGHYLKEFVADGVQWAHIDIAGPSNNTGSAYGYTPEGGTGVPVRTVLHIVEDIIANG